MWLRMSSTLWEVLRESGSPRWLSACSPSTASRGCRLMSSGRVVRRVAPNVDAVDQDPVDAAALAEVMYPHIEQAAEVCAEEADRFLIEGLELAPSYPARLRAALSEIEVRACFLGHGFFSAADLAGYRGPKPQSESGLSLKELRESASWIRHWSRQLRQQCDALRVPYVDVGQVGFEVAMAHARRLLLGCG